MAALAMVVVACSASSPSNASAIPTMSVPLDPAYKTSGIAWDDEALVVSLAESGVAGAPFRLVQIDSGDGHHIAERAPRVDSDCTRIDEWAPFNDAGTLVWEWSCATVGSGGRRNQILAADELLGKATVRSSVLSEFSGGALDVRGDTILASYGSRICETIARLEATAIEPVSIVVAGTGGTFDTGFRPGVGDCSSTGIAILPSTNVTGVTAFLASTEAIGRRGPSRLDTPFALYTVALGASTTATQLDFTLLDPTALTWTPNGKWLIASGRMQAGEGVWRIDPTTGASVRLFDVRVDALSWSTDGDQLAMIVPAMTGAEDPASTISIVATHNLLPGQ